MAAAKSRRRSLFDSDDEVEIAQAVENQPGWDPLSASSSSTSLAGANSEENAAQGEQSRLQRLEHRNSRLLFSSDEEDEPARSRASSHTTHRKTVLFDSEDESWFQPSTQRPSSKTLPGAVSDSWQSKYEEERRRRLELERELAECQEKLAALQTYTTAVEALVPEESLAQLAQQKQQDMNDRTQDEEDFDKEWQAMAEAEAERRAKKRQQRRVRPGNSTRVNLRQARKSTRKAALTPPVGSTVIPSVTPPPPTGSAVALNKIATQVAAPSPAQVHSKQPSVPISAKQSSNGNHHGDDDGWDSSESEGWSDDEPRPSLIEEQPSPNQAPTRQTSAPVPDTAYMERNVLQWAQHSDIVTMLMTVHQVFSGPLPPLPSWQHRPSSEEVRRAYLKIVRYCHPDKVAALGARSFHGSQAAYHTAITQSKLVFGALTDAYSMYKQLNGL